MMIYKQDSIYLRELYIGKSDAYKQLFEHYYIPLVLFSNSYLNDSKLSREFVQEAFIKLIKNENKCSSFEILIPYLYATLKDMCIKYISSKKEKDKHWDFIYNIEYNDDVYWKKVLEEEIYRNLIQNTEYSVELISTKELNIFDIAYIIAKSVKSELKESESQYLNAWGEISLYNRDLLRMVKDNSNLKAKNNDYSQIGWQSDFIVFENKRNKYFKQTKLIRYILLVLSVILVIVLIKSQL